MALLTWVLISRAQEMWATELRPLMEHAIEPLMAVKRDAYANNVTPVANLPSRQKGDGRGVGVPRKGGGVPLLTELPRVFVMPRCAAHEYRGLHLRTRRTLHIFTQPCYKSQQGDARRERAFESALGLTNATLWALDERTGSPAHQLRSHHHRRRR